MIDPSGSRQGFATRRPSADNVTDPIPRLSGVASKITREPVPSKATRFDCEYSRPKPAFRNVSIQIMPAGGQGTDQPCPGYLSRSDGRVTIGRCPLRRFIANIYGVSDSQVVGRDWSKEPSYEITADDTVLEAADRFAARRAVPAMMRNLLAKQFGLIAKTERKQMDGYVLTIGPTGPKVKSYRGSPSWKTMAWGAPDVGMSASDYPIGALAGFLEGVFKVPVIDDTGLKGHFEFEVTWNARPSPAVVAKALEDQLGLRLSQTRWMFTWNI